MHKFTVVLLLQLSCKMLCVYSDGVGLAPIDLAPIPCNDKAVEKLSRLAVTYINEDRDDGYKFALNRVANVHLHAQGPAGNVYYLDLDVLETKCHVGSPKPWKRCDIRPFMETQISGNCNTTILHTTEGYSYLYSYDCTLVPDPPEKLQQTCPTCPLLLPTDNAEAQDAARLSLAAYKRQSTIGAGLGVKKVTRASRQVAPVKASFVEYTVQECPEGVTRRGTCQRLTLQSDTETAGFCTGSVHGETNDQPDIQVSCEMFKLQHADTLRPVEPQGHDLPFKDIHPTPPYPIPDLDLQPVPSDPTLPPAVHPPSSFDPTPYDVPLFKPPAVDTPSSFDPTPFDVLPFDPSVLADPSSLLGSSSSESDEVLATTNRPRQPVSDSSSEEIGGPVALRPPFNFRYQKSFRMKRQVLAEVAAPHKPIFLSDFPSGTSPFRSCPGPARFTTV